MKKTAFISALSIGLLSIGLAAATPQQAVGQVKENANQVLGILAKANGSNNAQVRTQAENYAIPYFDFERMTALAVGIQTVGGVQLEAGQLQHPHIRQLA